MPAKVHKQRVVSAEAHAKNPRLAASIERRVSESLGHPLREAVREARARVQEKLLGKPQLSEQTRRIIIKEVFPLLKPEERAIASRLSRGTVAGEDFKRLISATVKILNDKPSLLIKSGVVSFILRKRMDAEILALGLWRNRIVYYRALRGIERDLQPEINRVKEAKARFDEALRQAKVDPRLQRVLDAVELRRNDPKRKELANFLAKLKALQEWAGSFSQWGHNRSDVVNFQQVLAKELSQNFSRKELLIIGKMSAVEPLTGTPVALAKKISEAAEVRPISYGQYSFGFDVRHTLKRYPSKAFHSSNAEARAALKDFLNAYKRPKNQK